MPKFRKKPVTIEAVQFNGVDPDGNAAFALGTPDAADPMPDWLTKALKRDQDEAGAAWLEPGYSPPALFIYTLEGPHLARPGDWIIQGIKGELYPCKPDIFAATYDAA